MLTGSMTWLKKGDRVGQYVIGSMLGMGGMAVVYEAYDERNSRQVAFKCLSPDIRTEELEKRFIRETRLLARLNHPNIVTIYDVGSGDNGLLYYVMERIEGRSVRDMLDGCKLSGKRHIDNETAGKIIRGVAEALSAAHELNILHRDVKPGNVMLSNDGRVLLLDFGLARGGGTRTLTREGVVVGTLRYLAPEQVASEPVSAASDIYAFGLMAYELFTGTLPFSEDDEVTMAIRRSVEQPAPPDITDENCAADFLGLIMRCLERQPSARFADGGQLLLALDEIERTRFYVDKNSATSENAVPAVRGPAGPDCDVGTPVDGLDATRAVPDRTPASGDVPGSTRVQPGDNASPIEENGTTRLLAGGGYHGEHGDRTKLIDSKPYGQPKYLTWLVPFVVVIVVWFTGQLQGVPAGSVNQIKVKPHLLSADVRLPDSIPSDGCAYSVIDLKVGGRVIHKGCLAVSPASGSFRIRGLSPCGLYRLELYPAGAPPLYKKFSTLSAGVKGVSLRAYRSLVEDSLSPPGGNSIPVSKQHQGHSPGLLLTCLPYGCDSVALLRESEVVAVRDCKGPGGCSFELAPFDLLLPLAFRCRAGDEVWSTQAIDFAEVLERALMPFRKAIVTAPLGSQVNSPEAMKVLLDDLLMRNFRKLKKSSNPIRAERDAVQRVTVLVQNWLSGTVTGALSGYGSLLAPYLCCKGVPVSRRAALAKAWSCIPFAVEWCAEKGGEVIFREKPFSYYPCSRIPDEFGDVPCFRHKCHRRIFGRAYRETVMRRGDSWKGYSFSLSTLDKRHVDQRGPMMVLIHGRTKDSAVYPVLSINGINLYCLSSVKKGRDIYWGHVFPGALLFTGGRNVFHVGLSRPGRNGERIKLRAIEFFRQTTP